MAKKIDIGVEHDHIESLTRANGITALSELIWNALDADATEIDIDYEPNNLGGFNQIMISDNEHGLDYKKAQDVFSRLGGSEKKGKSLSPNGRHYHGKEGKGRYKSLALGDLVTFNSTYQSNGHLSTFTITLDRGYLSYTEISDVTILPKGKGEKGVVVKIQNVNDESAEFALGEKSRSELEQKFASYWISYPNFLIRINGKSLDFNSLIKNSSQTEVPIIVGELTYKFVINVIEWNFDIKKKTYLCGQKGVPYKENSLGIRSPLPISIFIESAYIEKLHRENLLALDALDGVISNVMTEAKKFAKSYVRDRLHYYSKAYIQGLKEKGIYPYKDIAENIVEESKRQVFDIVALQVHEYLPSFDDQDDRNKRLTFSLLKEALENDSSSLRKILEEIIGLPPEKQVELAELLEDTSLSSIIDTMTEIRNRLTFINGLEQLIYEPHVNKAVKERKHLHKIVVRETWIFGDQYTYGVDDVTLKNVLKAYLRDALGRDDFEEVVKDGDNEKLQIIPDVCLWQQFSLGSAGKENLIIELKKPTVDAGFTEKSQIELYASRVASDERFPKSKTRWKFVLLTRKIRPELEPQMHQKNRRYGHVFEGENYDVFIQPWGHLLSEAKERHEYIKEKLKLNLQDNQKGLEYLRSKYKEYLPEDF
jgi:hypothetical protein